MDTAVYPHPGGPQLVIAPPPAGGDPGVMGLPGGWSRGSGSSGDPGVMPLPGGWTRAPDGQDGGKVPTRTYWHGGGGSKGDGSAGFDLSGQWLPVIAIGGLALIAWLWR